MGSLRWRDVTAREVEVLAAVGEHQSNVQIANRLHISVRTVESHVSALLRKCGASDRRELAALAAQLPDRGAPATEVVLPQARTRFVGRAAELASVRAALTTGRLVTLTGPGGVGKTRLAVEAAAAAATESPAMAYIDLVPVRPGLVVPTVASALGVIEHPPRPLLDSVVDRLRQRTMLLILDNCEHVLDDVGGLVESLLRSGPGLRILATSRERLGVAGEEALAIGPLQLRSDAEDLFLDRARGVDSGFAADSALVTAACTRLDGLPLAIELAAARAAAIGIDGLLAGLDDQLRVVAGARGTDRRHHSLRDVLGWSYDLLEPAERALFRQLSAFTSGFDLDGAAALSGQRPSTVAHLLGRLVEKSLVVREGGPTTSRWRLLGTIRAFAAEQLGRSDERDGTLRRYVEWAGRAAEELAARLDDTRWAAGYDEIVDDLRAAFALTEAAPDPSAHRLGRALGHLTFARGSLVEARAHLRDAAQRAGTAHDAVRDLRSAAAAAQALSDGQGAFDLLLAAADRAGDDRDRAKALASAVTITNRVAGGFRQGVPAARRDGLLRRAMQVRDENDPELRALLATARAWQAGSPHFQQPDSELAAAAVESAREAGDPALVLGALDVATAAAANHGRMRQAYQIARDRLDLLPSLAGHRPTDAAEITDAFHTVAVCALAVGDLPAAFAIAARVATEDPVNGDHPFVAQSKLVGPLALSGQFDEAIRVGESLYDEWQRVGRPRMAWLSPAVAAVALATGLRGTGDSGPWRSRALDIAGVADARQSRYLAAFAAFVDARLAVHAHRTADAATLVHNAFEDFSQPWYQAYAHAAGAELAVLAGLPDAAKRLDQAERSARECDWAAACVARARGRQTGDPELIRDSAKQWDRIGAQFEHTVTDRLATAVNAQIPDRP